MYLRKYTDKRINKTYLSIARGYRNSEGKTRTKIIQQLAVNIPKAELLLKVKMVVGI